MLVFCFNIKTFLYDTQQYTTFWPLLLSFFHDEKDRHTF